MRCDSPSAISSSPPKETEIFHQILKHLPSTKGSPPPLPLSLLFTLFTQIRCFTVALVPNKNKSQLLTLSSAATGPSSPPLLQRLDSFLHLAEGVVGRVVLSSGCSHGLGQTLPLHLTHPCAVHTMKSVTETLDARHFLPRHIPQLQ